MRTALIAAVFIAIVVSFSSDFLVSAIIIDMQYPPTPTVHD